MPQLSNKTLITIAGPTASGKTALAIELAKKWNTVIISADARQFYTEMSIGTAKPSAEELAAVPHYFINNLSVQQPYDVGKYAAEVLELLDTLFQQHDKIILCGGSGLFILGVCQISMMRCNRSTSSKAPLIKATPPMVCCP